MNHRSVNKEEDYDFARNDKVYKLMIPTYINEDGLVLYEIQLKDLVHNKLYTTKIRFKVIKDMHDKLVPLNVSIYLASFSCLPSQKLIFGEKQIKTLP